MNGSPTTIENSSNLHPDHRCYRRNLRMSSKVGSVGRSEDCAAVAAAAAAAVARGSSKKLHSDATDAEDAVVSAGCSADCAAD